jgi:hypothetical protein
MSKSVLRKLTVFMAFCFLFSVPAVVVAFDNDQSSFTPGLTKISLETNKSFEAPFINVNSPVFQAEDNNQCVDKCMQEMMKCMFGGGGAPGGKKCDNELNQCLSECEKTSENNMSLAQFMRNR